MRLAPRPVAMQLINSAVVVVDGWRLVADGSGAHGGVGAAIMRCTFAMVVRIAVGTDRRSKQRLWAGQAAVVRTRDVQRK
jgi:hypothetical protein